MKNVYDVLLERGFIEQMTHEDEIKKMLAEESVTFYIGFDPTANSLTVGHFLTVMAMSHMQRAGHRPIALVGGGTGMVGDPTGKVDMRKMMTIEQVRSNVASFKEQLGRFLDFTDDRAIMVDNAEWLLELNYVEFLRDIGVHFSVNRMLTAECFKSRMEKGLSFLEFNYMLMQSYDFLELNRRYNCKLQLGGNDQWSNIISGVDLIRRVGNKSAYGMTFTLLTTSEGKKMGKTESGAIWLDPEKTSPYEFYQYWRNTADSDVIKCLKLLTFLPMEEINDLAKLEGKELNKAKEILAYEFTKIVHGEKEAELAKEAALSLFGGGGVGGSCPTTKVTAEFIGTGVDILTVLEKCELIPSRGEGRRLIQQGGIKINDIKIEKIDHVVVSEDFKDGSIMIQKGKKVFHTVTI